MNDLTTMNSLMQQVHAMKVNHWDHMVDIRAIHFDSLEMVWIDGKPCPVTRTAQRRIAERLGIPHAYLKRCPSWLQAENLNAWLRTLIESGTMQVRFRDETVRAFFSPRYVPMDNHQVLSLLLDLGIDPDSAVQARLDDDCMSISIPDAGQHFVLNDGDGYLPGFNIRNSEVGTSSLWINAFLLRLVCTNGMLMEENIFSVSYPHINRKVVQELPDVIAKATQCARVQGEQRLRSLHQPVENAETLFKHLDQRFGLTFQERSAVRWGYAQDSGQTLFHVLNGYTKGSQFPGLSASSTIKLQRVGGVLLDRRLELQTEEARV